MSKGSVFPAEAVWSTDPVTGARVRQITSHPSISHPTYFLQSAFIPGDRGLFFVSYRTGSAQLFAALYPEGGLMQMTEGEALHPFSPALHPYCGEIVFTRGGAIWAINVGTLEERLIVDSRGQLGEPSISPDAEWVTAAYAGRENKGLAVCRMDGSDFQVIHFGRTVIHPQFHPLEPEWIEFAADPAPRMHRVRLDGRGLECLYSHGNDEFVVHETFLGSTGDLVFTIWPRRLCRLNWETRQISTITEYNAWHIAPNRDGTTVLCDTNHPDEGLQLIDVHTGARKQICLTGASNRGSQWKRSSYATAEDFAAAAATAGGGSLSWFENAGDSVYGPQWTHPHPSWSRTETRVAFASDRSGTTQVYVVEL